VSRTIDPRKVRWRYLRPGTGIKRWLVLIFVGQLLLATAGALAIRMVFRDVDPDSLAGQLFGFVTLQALPLFLRPVLVLVAGGAIVLYGLWRLMNVLLEPFPARTEPLVELVYQKRSLARGPRIVAIGGGTGLSTLLRGLKEVTSNITAVVTVADDGGSSGKLREEYGIAPVGDIRNCIAALADAEPAMTRLLQYRFPQEESETGGLAGHAFGNLLIAALSDIAGDFEEGVRESNRVLAVRGRVVPVTPTPLTLHAEMADGSLLDGQSAIMRTRGIRRVWVTPEDCDATIDAIAAINAAELIVIGPGSLYTSLLPALVVPGVADALAAASAKRVFVCNVATQPGETEGYTLSEHLAALNAHGVGGLFDVVVANGNRAAKRPTDYRAEPVRIDVPDTIAPRLVIDDVVDDENAHRHDPRKLTNVLMRLHDETTTAVPVPAVVRSA
jgi:uncharacterized cofD-like protein